MLKSATTLYVVTKSITGFSQLRLPGAPGSIPLSGYLLESQRPAGHRTRGAYPEGAIAASVHPQNYSRAGLLVTRLSIYSSVDCTPWRTAVSDFAIAAPGAGLWSTLQRAFSRLREAFEGTGICVECGRTLATNPSCRECQIHAEAAEMTI